MRAGTSKTSSLAIKKAVVVCLGCIGLALSIVVQATPVVLTLEGVGDIANVNDFYNGGTDSQGHSGTDYGVHFSDTSLGLIDSDASGTGIFGNEPTPDTILFFLSGGAATMNVAAGFDTGFSFFYTSPQYVGSVTVYDGLDSTGNILATLTLNMTDGSCSGDPTGTPFCAWLPIGVNFNGIAHSVDFSGTANHIAFDNITLGAAIPGGGGTPVPEPAGFGMMTVGLALLSGLYYRRRFF